jgi:Skp family chaperone for outer membrane proteins
MVQFSRVRMAALMAVIAVAGAGVSFGADAPAPDDRAPVTRAEWEAFQKELKQMQAELQELRKERASGGGGTGAAAATNPEDVTAMKQEIAELKKQQKQDAEEAQATADEIMKVVKEVQAQAKADSPGTTRLLITGDANVGFAAVRGSPSTFFADFSPRMLFEINDRLYFDGALDFNLSRDSNPVPQTDGNGNPQTVTEVSLGIASLNYLVNDYLTVGMGQFVAQFAAYHRYFDPPWINKLPDDPLVFSDGGLAPNSVLGAYVSGAYPLSRDSKINYALYLSNGGELDFTNGSLSHDNFVDTNNNKAVGGRVGYLPIPYVEVGYSVQYGEVQPASFTNGSGTTFNSPHVGALLQAVDVNFVKTIEPIGGQLTLRTEWVFSHVSNTHAPDGSTSLDGNDRNGGYGMVAYRPSLSPIKWLRNFELIFRYDRMDLPSDQAPLSGQATHEQRFTTGLDYWVDARTVVKVAYECDEQPHAPGADAILFQIGMGF